MSVTTINTIRMTFLFDIFLLIQLVLSNELLIELLSIDPEYTEWHPQL